MLLCLYSNEYRTSVPVRLSLINSFGIKILLHSGDEMRIIAGKARRLQLKTVDGLNTATDRIKNFI
ncbi:MAG: hypothetical protein ACLR1A_04370 [Eubacterium ventriosum]